MATRSTICVAIPSEFIGKKYQYKNDEFKFETPEIKIPEGAKFIEVYHHWDGDVEGLGAELIEETEDGTPIYGDFDTIMKKLISGGDMSTTTQPYHAWRNENWDWVKPKFYEEMPKVSELYQYLFKNGKWYVRDGYTYKRFRIVSNLLKKLNA